MGRVGCGSRTSQRPKSRSSILAKQIATNTKKQRVRALPTQNDAPYGKTATPDIWHVAIPHKGTKKDDRDLWHQKSMTTCEMNCSQGEHQLKLIIEHCSKDFAPAVLLRPSP